MENITELLSSSKKFNLPTKNFDKYILVGPGSDYGKAMWTDIGVASNGVVLDNTLKDSGKIVHVLHHAHFSFAINNKCRIPLQHLWAGYYSLNDEIKDNHSRYCVIYTDVSASRTDEKYLAELSQSPNVLLVLVLVNTMRRRGNVIKRRLKYFKYIFSFDRKDCDNYDFIYHPTNYSCVNIDNNGLVENDAFFVGVSKGRANQLNQIYQRILSAGGKLDFYISGVKKQEKTIEGIHYNKWLNYGQVLEHIKRCNCIVEVMDGAQEGVTLRTMEAVCYNKRLLTNNKAVMASPFYKKGNIQVFNNIEDISTEFVMDRRPVEYNYHGEFSPLHLIEHINEVTEL